MEQTLLEVLNQKPRLSPQEVLASLSDIELTEEEIAIALIQAKKDKKRAVAGGEEMQASKRIYELLSYDVWSIEQVGEYAIQLEKSLRANTHNSQRYTSDFEIDENNKSIFNLLCAYFADDPFFLTECERLRVKNPSLEKGLLLAGNFGVGKTRIMRLFSRNRKCIYTVHSAKKIANSFELSGQPEITPHENLIRGDAQSERSFYQEYFGLCIDDIGTEDIKLSFGNRKNVIGDIFELRYDRRATGKYLHATTNLTGEQLTEMYGGRVTSRFKEIFNFIELPGIDRRK